MINALSKQVIFLGDFNSKHKQFGCVKPNKSGQTLVNIAKDLKLFYVNQLEPNRHMREDPVHGTSDILDMAFITPGLSFRDISFSVADDHMSSDHFPIQISIDRPLKWNTPLTEPRYQFDKTNDDLLHNTLKDSLTNIFENIWKTTVSLVNTSQALGNPSQQMTIFFVSPRPSWKASIGENV